MAAQWWSWALTLIGLTGWWLTGRRLWQGWAVSLAVQTLWLAYALVTGQHGFIVAAVAYGAMAAHNLRRWRKSSPQPTWVHYRHQADTCPTRGDCRGHRIPAGPEALELLADLRRAGLLAHSGSAPQPTWLTRLAR